MSGHGHDDCIWCEGYTAAVKDILERGAKALVEVTNLRDKADADISRMRLHGKAQGVDLMLSYAREMEPKS